MRGIILAAGRGSRMGRLTDAAPKCLTELAGKTLLEWQIAALNSAGVETLTIIGGYRKSDLEGFGCPVLVNPRWDRTNMVASLMCADTLLAQGECLVSYSDIVYHPDVVRRLAQAEADVAISYDTRWRELWEARFDDPLLDAETFSQHNGCLTDIGRKTADPSDIGGRYIGLLKFRPEGWAATRRLLQAQGADALDSLDMTSLLRVMIGAGLAVHTVAVQGGWCEVDTEQDLQLYAARAATRGAHGWSHDWRW